MQRYGSVDLVDRLISVGHGEGHLIEVRVVVHKRCVAQAHVRRSGFRTACCGSNSHGKGEVALVIQAGADIIHSVSAHRVRLAIIVQRAVVTMQRYGSVDLVDL